MDKQDTTITGGLGLPAVSFDQTLLMVQDAWDANTTVSDALLQIGTEMQEDELATEVPLSAYEKRLVLAGYLAGRHHAKTELREKMLQEVMEAFLKSSRSQD